MHDKAPVPANYDRQKQWALRNDRRQSLSMWVGLPPILERAAVCPDERLNPEEREVPADRLRQ